MKEFFGDDLLLSSGAAERLYAAVRDLPIIDYHCHLNEYEIRDNIGFANLGALWLGGDHYKWRAMRLCGVDEHFITGDATDYEKYRKYAEIFPHLCGSPLYYWTQLELKELFGITKPLSDETAEEIWNAANERLKDMRVSDILRRFRVEYIATTNDPTDKLDAHGICGGTRVAPTFRPDRMLTCERAALDDLRRSVGMKRVQTLDEVKAALVNRLDWFTSHGCVISDHGMDFLPVADCGEGYAEAVLDKLTGRSDGDPTPAEREALASHLLYFLAGEYRKRGMVMQLHFGTYRNVNSEMFGKIGRDAGFDIMRGRVDADRLAVFLDTLDARGHLPKTVLYSLNPTAVPAIATLSGAFRNVRVGAAWWFNDTVAGIRQQLSTVAEYTALGTHLGMLTDSRSFASYPRFDFFRRILCDTVGAYVERGEYDSRAAEALVTDICYRNVKEFLGIGGEN
ncbi:MAG TPA: glucuronate isomerase [Clostridiales bacterium]|nr:glucuronate isomerase [Clostridiales bacterium]